MLDIHPPHETPHGFRDFALHLFTITIGLLIALSLEGLVDWRHHRHLVHTAEAALQNEIASNAKDMASAIADVEKHQTALTHDAAVLKIVIATGRMPKDHSMEIGYGIRTFDNVAWKTAQTTGALGYMPYDDAQKYAEIYSTQDQLRAAEDQAARDAIIALGPFINASDKDPDPTPAQAAEIKAKIETLQGQLMLVHSLMQGLSQEYKDFEK